MARIRTIKPEFPQSESMGRVSRDARLLFVMLWTICDDHGRTRASSRMLASLLFPYDDDAYQHIPEWLMELEREGTLRVYCIDGNTYLQIEKWTQHQKIDRPSGSKFPAPPEKLAKPREGSRKTRVGPGPRTKEGIKDQGRDLGGSDPLRADAPPDPTVVTLPTNREGEEFPVLQTHVEDFAKAYPSVDVGQEFAEMRVWLIANPTLRKTRKGMLRFANSWLAREQDKGRRPGQGPPGQSSGVNPISKLLEAEIKKNGGTVQ